MRCKRASSELLGVGEQVGNPGAGLVSSHPFALREAWQLSSTGIYYLQEMATHWKERENEYCLTHTTTAVEDAALISTALTLKLLVSSDRGHGWSSAVFASAKKRCKMAQPGRGFLCLLLLHMLNSFLRKHINANNWQTWGHLSRVDALELTLDILPLQALDDPRLQEAGPTLL